MTPQEKAEELVELYLPETQDWDEIEGYTNDYARAKKCALIAVDEIVKEIDIIMFPNPFKQYWNKVKQEIQKL